MTSLKCPVCEHVMCVCDEWRGTGEAGWRVEMLAKDSQIRSLTEQLSTLRGLLREAVEGRVTDTSSLTMVRHEWFSEAQAALEGKP